MVNPLAVNLPFVSVLFYNNLCNIVDLCCRSIVVIVNEHHVFPATYFLCPWLIDYWVHCCFQEGRVRVTLLARSTEYRRILNQVEVSPALHSFSLYLSFCLSLSLLHPFSYGISTFFMLFFLLLSILSFILLLLLSLFSLHLSLPHSSPFSHPLPLTIDLLPAFLKCLFKILFAINSRSKKGL